MLKSCNYAGPIASSEFLVSVLASLLFATNFRSRRVAHAAALCATQANPQLVELSIESLFAQPWCGLLAAAIHPADWHGDAAVH